MPKKTMMTPDFVYAVITDKACKVFAAYGHATNYYTKQAEAGHNPKIIKYLPETTAIETNTEE